MAEMEGYIKIVAKVADWASECSIPCFYKGEDIVHFMSRFTNQDQGLLSQNSRAVIDSNISIADAKKSEIKRIMLSRGFIIRQLGEDDIQILVDLYRPCFRFTLF